MPLATVPEVNDRFDFRLVADPGATTHHSVIVRAVAQHGDRTGVLYVREATGEWHGSSLDEFTRAYPHRLGRSS